jgi:hypothetical protein
MTETKPQNRPLGYACVSADGQTGAMAVPARRVRMGRRPDPVRLSEDGRERRDNDGRLKSPQQAGIFWTLDVPAPDREL